MLFYHNIIGHTDLKVTRAYSKRSVRMKLGAMDKMNSEKHDVIPEITNGWTQDKSLMAWLTGPKDKSV
jgi:hypothetical protein